MIMLLARFVVWGTQVPRALCDSCAESLVHSLCAERATGETVGFWRDATRRHVSPSHAYNVALHTRGKHAHAARSLS